MTCEEGVLVSNSHKCAVWVSGGAAFRPSFIFALTSFFPATHWLSPHGGEHGGQLAAPHLSPSYSVEGVLHYNT